MECRAPDYASARLSVAIGPRKTGFGSWDWLGEDLAQGLSESCDVSLYHDEPAAADITLFIKFLPALPVLRGISERSRIVYCPVDVYGSAAEIDRDAERLMLCHVIVVHSPRLCPYFQSYAPTRCFDHHLKYVIPTRERDYDKGSLLWVGVRSNLAPLVDYLNHHALPGPLVVLTNPEQESDLQEPARWGFHPRNQVRMDSWTPESHRSWLMRCRAALDFKGDDFRSRHKPAAKALDFLASGVPLAMNRSSSSSEYVRSLGFEIASLDDPETWLSAEYAARTRTFGERISSELTLPRLARQWHELLSQLADRETNLRPSAGKNRSMGWRREEPRKRRTRIAIVSLLFNWPSTGGGTVHTAETARFLTRAGYDVRHFVIQQESWKLGQVLDPVDWPIERVSFDDEEWRREAIQDRIRERVRAFQPDAVIITDSWNFKPRLAEALREFPCYLRLAAQECLCPLNNVRMLWDKASGFQSCPRHQLATPQFCRTCVQQQQSHSGGLHRAERELAGYFQDDYEVCLRRSVAEAAGILVVNQQIAQSIQPYAQKVHVIPSGFDPGRFSEWSPARTPATGPVSLVFAGLVTEPMKGFAVLWEACRRLWSVRQDFRLLATADPPGPVDDFTEYVGWRSQADLPALLREADIVVCPTIAEEALGRTAVEGMGVGRPVVASRIGGLSFTVLDEATGLLCDPGNSDDLARQISRLLDDPALRERLGTAGRRRFETHYTWPVILERHYRPLLGGPWRTSVAEGAV